MCLGNLRPSFNPGRNPSVPRIEPAYDICWQRVRRAYLYRNHVSAVRFCGDVADHFPLSQRELVARGEADPDGARHLRPLCVRCHNRETAKRQPGGGGCRERQADPVLGHGSTRGVPPTPLTPERQGGKKLAWLIRSFWRR
ncbi:hypothetical protein GCM10014713_17210 [Streptomyces purpureus]|uniref:HNH endonuclease n=1 Tax=Streptomyces purpureus TaxID=1951 RepID=A0A918H046_9ACTN|nr:hypothetical protein GCM10014713_17210 [Streptomyces purpureus]